MRGHRHSNIHRNIHFVDGKNNEISSAWQNGPLTWSEMAEWIEVVVEEPVDSYAPFRCLELGDPVNPLAQHGPAIVMQGNNNQISTGFYVILSPDGASINIRINRQNPMPRTSTRASSSKLDPRTKTFRNRVRERDGRCVVTGEKPLDDVDFVRLEAAHIFPLAHLDMWKAQLWQRQITDDRYVGESGINSVQNGILLRSDVHQLFDTYRLAINPDRGYKTYCFANVATLDHIQMYQDPDTVSQYQPCRGLLKHHFRMCVLLNMKGRAGYPKWDEDLPPGCDDMAEVASSEEGKLRLETILASKLNHLIA
ncbi:hypothetical protein VC83_00753 [Pseudogymnoascus destructans]|uniref:HNH nuclease domain-containing protein n=2 Tax=Pseudogymnoascus destructans TaxID=655981 RepID=L8G9U4_PSED2|nr:uncharacterized protein VC83_00753 [Pseudogymnoascus destructans]ELR08811.1 hypothetical protein GMDG_03487 [Pseudogymnoascus destructans 20631-21]OAF62354.1 hypothetical protein VC83_00753 [Pseudogymnoascus destructans]